MPVLVNPAVRKKFESGRWKPLISASIDEGFVPWDIVALFTFTRPHLFQEWEVLEVFCEACDAGEPCVGTMHTTPLVSKGICHEPSCESGFMPDGTVCSSKGGILPVGCSVHATLDPVHADQVSDWSNRVHGTYPIIAVISRVLPCMYFERPA
jgi:hypothetical protein